MQSENIAAISTGNVPSGVAVIRISGDNPLSIAEKCFKPSGKTAVKDFTPYRLYPGEIQAEGFCDHGLCVYFKSPKSFTGEDVVEFQCHGGLAITHGILKKILSLGARLATKGEFTKRAFINGKLSLASAEGLIEMINGESVSGVRAGYSLYREKLTRRAEDMQNALTTALAEIDADMDFPEEDLESLSTENVRTGLNGVTKELASLINGYSAGRTLVKGVKVAIVGKPNVGKSSLLNALLNYDKAIVSSVAGTTRDAVEGRIDINDVPFFFTDTAGIRETSGEIEKIGVEMSKKILESADVILFVTAAGERGEEDEKIYSLVKNKNCVTAVNKIDTVPEKHTGADVFVSATAKTGIDELKNALYEKAVGKVDLGSEFVCEERHYAALKKAKEKLDLALSGLGEIPLELVAMDIKDGWDALGEITGKTASEEIINEIFSKFCVGK